MKNSLVLKRISLFTLPLFMIGFLHSCVLLIPEQKAIFTYQNGTSFEMQCRDVEFLGGGCWECDQTIECGVQSVCFPCQ